MKISKSILNSNHNIATFKGKKMPGVDDIVVLKRFVNCGLNGLERNLVQKIEKKAPQALTSIDGQKYVKNFTFIQNLTEGIKSFASLPLDFVDFIAKKFPNSKLNNAEFLNKYRDNVLLGNEIKALQGIHESGLEFLEDIPNKKYPTGGCNISCKMFCKKLTDKYNKSLNKSMEGTNSTYDTKVERFVARLVSGCTAAWFLGKDFYNKSILKGKTQDEAKKEQHLKQGQEVKENLCEGIAQFAVFACFSKFVNANIWASALIGTAIGLVSRVYSRVSSGMPIRRMDVPQQKAKTSYNVPTVNEYKDSIKNKKPVNFFEVQKETAASDTKNKKKPILSLRNILLLCAASIGIGFGLRGLGKNTAFGKRISDYFSQRAQNFENSMVEKIWVDNKTFENFVATLKSAGEDTLSEKIKDIGEYANKNGKIYLGERYKTTNLFGKFEVQTKDLKRLKTAPFRCVAEIFTYPYKMANNLYNAIKKNKKVKVELDDPHSIKNIYLKYKEFENKFGSDPEKLNSEFGDYIYKMRLASNNKVTSSKNDNSKIAVLAQTLGTLTGMGFSMNDEFNSTVRNGGTLEEAQRDARRRGVNKFARMGEQVIISHTLNGIFTKQYNGSILGAGIIVFVSTMITDVLSRITAGMPFKKIDDKQEYEKQLKERENGIAAKYNKVIDKLTQ